MEVRLNVMIEVARRENYFEQPSIGEKGGVKQ